MTTRLLIVTTPPEDDPCSPCAKPRRDPSHRPGPMYHHPFTGPREVAEADIAAALAVVFAYNASNASVAPSGSLAFGTGPTSYWRDRAEAILAALAAPEPAPTTGWGPCDDPEHSAGCVHHRPAPEPAP